MKLNRSLACSILIGAGVCAPALAALGGDAASVEADRVRLKGVLRVTPVADYVVHELQAPSGLVVREYLSANGKVFAVSWRGPGIPDLHPLLGSYYAQFEQSASAPHYNHHHLTVQTPELVVQSSGHLRSFYGRAWATALLPQNFSLSNLN